MGLVSSWDVAEPLSQQLLVLISSVSSSDNHKIEIHRLWTILARYVGIDADELVERIDCNHGAVGDDAMGPVSFVVAISNPLHVQLFIQSVKQFQSHNSIIRT